MLQLLIDIATAGTAQDHTASAHVVTVDNTTPESLAASRAAAESSIADIFGRVASGWTPTSAAESVATADAKVALAKAALADAEKTAADAHKTADDAAKAEAAEPDNAPAAKPFTGKERRTNITKRRLTDTGNSTGKDRRVGPTDRRTPAQT